MNKSWMNIKFLNPYFIRVFMGVILLAELTSCGGPPPPTPQIFLQVVDVIVDPKANLDTAVAMDLIVVYEDGLVDTLFKLSANEYFSQKQQIIRDNPGQIDIWSWEVVPGQIVPLRSITLSQYMSRGGIFFANYLTPGDHRIRAGKESGAKITLGPKDLSLQPFTPD